MLKKLRRAAGWARTTARSALQLGSVLRISARLAGSPKYLFYLTVQREKSLRYSARTHHRTPQLISKFLKALNWSPERLRRSSVLCVGCRNTYELDLFERSGFGEVVGVDLFSHDPRVHVMDMHSLDFPNGRFDVVYTCHSLEHSYAPETAVSEFLRVTKPDGACVVEVPVRFVKSATDLQDFGSVEGVRQLFEPHVSTVLFAEEVRDESSGNVARFAFEMRRAA